MRGTDILSYSAGSIKTQKGRAALTILGVVVGITAIVALNSLSGGFENLITGQLETGLSTNTLTVTSGSSFAFGGGGETTRTLYADDVDGLENINHVTVAMGVLTRPGVHMTADGRNYSVSITGVNFTRYAQVYTAFSTTTDGGKGYITDDNESFVIGQTYYKPYDNDTILVDAGDNITIHWQDLFAQYQDYTANITGVLGEIGGFSLSGGPSDRSIFLPIDRAVDIFQTSVLSSIVVLLDSSDDAVINQVSDDIKAYFGDGVSVLSATSLLGTINQVFGTLSIFLTAIAAISLIVAGIGIMNIMTVSILERTREIGILKALGAKDRTIAGIFIVEAFLIGLIGSLIGIGLGYVGSFALGGLLTGFSGGRFEGGPAGASASGFVPVLTPMLVVQALAFGIIVAVVFALYPAIKASRKPPVEALRHE